MNGVAGSRAACGRLRARPGGCMRPVTKGKQRRLRPLSSCRLRPTFQGRDPAVKGGNRIGQLGQQGPVHCCQLAGQGRALGTAAAGGTGPFGPRGQHWGCVGTRRQSSTSLLCLTGPALCRPTHVAAAAPGSRPGARGRSSLCSAWRGVRGGPDILDKAPTEGKGRKEAHSGAGFWNDQSGGPSCRRTVHKQVQAEASLSSTLR